MLYLSLLHTTSLSFSLTLSTVLCTICTDGWEWARKGVAPAFSNANLYKTLPMLADKLASFCEILDDKAEKGEVMEDWAGWCTRLTIDLISSSMFSSNFDTIHEHSTDRRGWTYIQQFPIVLREFAVLNAGKCLKSSYPNPHHTVDHILT